MKSIMRISAASILLAASYPAFAQAPAQDQTKPPQGVSTQGAMPMPEPMDQTGSGMMPMGAMSAQGQAPAAMQPGAMPMGNMPTMQGQPGAMQPAGMPCMQGQPGTMPMGGQPSGMGMTMNPAMMQAHMQRMEAHMATMETLLRQLVELQQQK